MKMSRLRLHGRMPLMALAALVAAMAPALVIGQSRGAIRTTQSAAPTGDPQTIGDRAIANDHRDDSALETYERIQREILTTGGSRPRILSDKTVRIVPTGTGTLHLLLRENGASVSPSAYRDELETWARTLEMAVNPANPELQGALAKAAARRAKQAKIVESFRQAYIGAWLGRESQDGHLCDKLQLRPNPSFQSYDTPTEFLSHARVLLWVDTDSGQVARAEAEIVSDVSFGGGILGKIYRGGHFLLKQRPVAPGIWLPYFYQYDYAGRKVLFTFEEHKKVDITRYRDLGAVSHALAVARSDIATGGALPGDR
jgi:hypothetical protein